MLYTEYRKYSGHQENMLHNTPIPQALPGVEPGLRALPGVVPTTITLDSLHGLLAMDFLWCQTVRGTLSIKRKPLAVCGGKGLLQLIQFISLLLEQETN